MLYGGAMMLSLLSCIYLLFRHGNAFEYDVVSPVRVRRWAAALFAAMFHSHLAWSVIGYPLDSNEISYLYVYAMATDALMLPPFLMATLLSMLQDRRRPIWPAFAAMTPVVAIAVISFVHKTDYVSSIGFPYILVVYSLFFIYILYAVRQYGRWLRDNYADLEHKEVWQSILIGSILSLLFCSCLFNDGGMTFEYFIQIVNILFILLLLWRVETLEQLEEPAAVNTNVNVWHAGAGIGSLLDQFCVQPQLYLRHDLSLSQLAESIGTNRSYLSHYFAENNQNYNTYINDLRVRHFLNLYDEAIRTRRAFTAQSLAYESGFRSYRTFSDSFKRLMGQNVTDWQLRCLMTNPS